VRRYFFDFFGIEHFKFGLLASSGKPMHSVVMGNPFADNPIAHKIKQCVAELQFKKQEEKAGEGIEFGVCLEDI